MTQTQMNEADIRRERKQLFYQCNMFIRHFPYCSLYVKWQLFKTFCPCLYGAALWSTFSATAYKTINESYYPPA